METRSGKIINVLSEVISKPGKRPFTVHRVVLGGGEEVEVGFKQPYRIGDMFNSEVEFKFGKYKEVKPLGAAAPSSASTATPAAQSPMAFPIPKANKETAIIRQNALTNAVNAVNCMVNNKALEVADTNAYVDEVLTLAYKFAEFSSGQREIRLSKELVGNDD